MCINEGDLVKVFCRRTGYIVTVGRFVRKTEEHYIIATDYATQLYRLSEWEVERIERD